MSDILRAIESLQRKLGAYVETGVCGPSFENNKIAENANVCDSGNQTRNGETGKHLEDKLSSLTEALKDLIATLRKPEHDSQNVATPQKGMKRKMLRKQDITGRNKTGGRSKSSKISKVALAETTFENAFEADEKTNFEDSESEDLELMAAKVIGEEMTESIVRKCPTCEKRFVKDSNCNIVECKCGSWSCFLCGSLLVNNIKLCPCEFLCKRKLTKSLYTKAALRAKLDLLKKYPSLKFKYDPSVKKRLENNNKTSN